MFRTAFFALLAASVAFAQAGSQRPKFDVAVVKLNKSGATEPSGGIHPGGQFSATNLSMMELLPFAYGVDADAISGLPPWFRTDRFDVVAKGPANTSDATLRLMLQSLLASEFQLVMHSEPKPREAFALIAAKGGPKLQKTVPVAGPRPSDDPSDPNEHCKRTFGRGVHAVCTNITMAELAKRLPSLAPAQVDRPVVDLTGIAGAYDFKLDWVGKGQADADVGPTIFDALTKQLGLKLEQRKLPLPSLVIDRVQRLR